MKKKFGVGKWENEMISEEIEENKEIGSEKEKVNKVVMEWNEGKIKDIKEMEVKEENERIELSYEKVNVKKGNVGEGKGMKCLGLKGGIGN